MKYIAFGDTVAGFASIRLNNLLLANGSSLRTGVANAYALTFEGKCSDCDLPVVNQVMSMYDCHYTDELPPAFKASIANPQKAPRYKSPLSTW